MIALVIGGLFTGLATSPAVLFLALAGGVLGGVALFMWTERILLAGIVERISSDERTVVQAGNLIRELLGVAAGDWSELRRQVAQLRMERFPIAPEERT
jgi:hypothetical protein